MILAKIVFYVFACTSVTKYVLVASQGDDKTERPLENHTFVALINIVFVDGTKRVCTGTIIHDNAIITAAHCFLKHGSDYSDVELSGSYIALGTKKMFDTGYESYLPIERVITHPKYRGWTADLALVFTFSGMTTDKPGRIVPIVEENESTPVDSNVTILSWGNYCDEQVKQLATTSGATKRYCTSEEGDSCESRKHKVLREKSMSKEHADNGEDHKASNLEPTDAKHRSFQAKVKSESTTIVLPSITTSNSGEVPSTMNVQTLSQDKDRDQDRDRKDKNRDQDRDRDETKERIDTTNGPAQSKEKHGTTEVKKPALSIGSPYLIPSKGKAKKKVTSVATTTKKHRYEKTHRNASIGKIPEDDALEKEPDWSKVLESVIQRAGLNISKDEVKEKQSIKSRRSNKRHKHPPSEENKLTVETFGFVNVQTCKKLIDKALPKLYKINTNEVVCYASEDHFISDDDSGAPAIREGRLVAVTVGGAECEGDHVAIGMKMTCYCSWILENLPPGENTWKCCTDCCGEEKKDHNNKDRNNKDRDKENEKKDATYLRSNRKKKSRKHSEEDD